MFQKTIAGALALLCLPTGHATPTLEKPSMTRLAALAGNWAIVAPDGEATTLRAIYQVLAGGSGVMETLLAGTPEETVTLYHREKRWITATQLSGRGDPARLAPRGGGDADTLRFEATADEVDAGQLSGLDLTLIDEEHIRIVWALATGAGEPELRTFELQREAPLEELAAEVGRIRVNLESLQRELDRRLKRRITRVDAKGDPEGALLETRTLPPGPGWNVSGVPLALYIHEDTMRFASSFASKGDGGLTVAHYGFEAGPGCRMRFSVLGGHAFVAVVLEQKAPPRKIKSIPDFAVALEGGEYGTLIHKIAGKQLRDPRAVEWDLAPYAGKRLRLYLVDASNKHWGQVSLSEVSIVETAEK